MQAWVEVFIHEHPCLLDVDGLQGPDGRYYAVPTPEKLLDFLLMCCPVKSDAVMYWTQGGSRSSVGFGGAVQTSASLTYYDPVDRRFIARTFAQVRDAPVT